MRAPLGLHQSLPSLELSGTTVNERQVRGFRLVEKKYPAALELPLHTHQNSCLVLVIEGTYVESYGSSSSVTCNPGTLRYLPARQKHANVFRDGARCLIVEIEGEAVERVQQYTGALQGPGEIQSILSTWLAQRLYREFLQNDPLALISLEGILLEILADGARSVGAPGPSKVVPRWLRVAREYLESNFLRPLSLAEVATIASVHRVHLSREFRRHYATTVGEFLRRKRVEHACHLVSKTNEPLADVAMTCGFSDQSHFSATFRRHVGLTPGRFRQMAQSH